MSDSMDDSTQITEPVTDNVTTKITSDKAPAQEPQYPLLFKKKLIPAHMRPTKFSSTSSLFLDSTISKPKNAELVRCIGEYLHKLIRPTESATEDQRNLFEIFDENEYPLVTRTTDDSIPDMEVIEKFVKNIFKIGQLAPESLVMGVAYIDRIIANGFKMYPFNWKRISLAALILASKVWEDQAVWNVDFIDLFPLCSPTDLGALEKKILSLLSFDVSINASEYARIYFDLRAQSVLSGEQFSELKPLDKDGQTNLEVKTTNYVMKHTKKLHRSSGSVDDISSSTKVKSPRVVLN